MLGLILLFAVASVGSTDGNDEIGRRLAELEELLHTQQKHIQEQDTHIHEQDLEIEDLKHQERRLTDSDTFDSRITALNASLLEESSARQLQAADMKGGMNHIWLLLCGALVMFMQSGFAMLTAGCCRAKNVQNILLKNMVDVAVGTLGWWATGFALAYGNPDADSDGLLDGGFAGSMHFFGSGFVEMKDGSWTPAGGKQAAWFFQWAFCSAAATIVSGGVAERAQFPAYCIFSFLMTGFIYPVVVAWTWGYGWLASFNDIGYMDFAGSGIVHMTGGVAALVGAIIVGPRDGRWENPSEFVPHSLPLVVLGTFILWFGWYGFNCGSTLALADEATGELAAHVAMNTTISAATGGLTVFLLRMVLLRGLYDIGGFCNGILAGLVSITAPCATVHSHDAFFIGMIGGVLYQGASMLLKRLKIDDPIDAFPVHGVCGAWGVLAAGLFDWGKGFDHANGWDGFSCKRDDDGKCISGLGGQLIVANVVEILAVTAWVGTLSALIFLALRLAGFLRVDSEKQVVGNDEAKHSPTKAYVIDESSKNTALRISDVVNGQTGV